MFVVALLKHLFSLVAMEMSRSLNKRALECKGEETCSNEVNSGRK